MLCLLLGFAEALRSVSPRLRAIGLPTSIIAGIFGMVLGPGLLDLMPVSLDVLKAGVYHALGIVFIAVGLQKKDRETNSTTGRSMAFAITALAAFQTMIGLFIILVLGTLVAQHYHPGMGLIFSIGFQQGPGQALALGNTWEKAGMVDGADIGLIVAAVGFLWSVVIGVPLVAWGKARGLLSNPHEVGPKIQETRELKPSDGLPAAGSLDTLTRQLVLIGIIYVITLALCAGLSLLLGGRAPAIFDGPITPFSGKRSIADSIWGFHFMIGALIAMLVRPRLAARRRALLDNRSLGHIASVTVDFATVSALSAVQISVLTAFWLPIALMTTLGGVATLFFVVWVARRAFDTAPFEHCILWFGMATGTLPMGLALLRIVDPELRCSAPQSAVVGSAGAIIGVAPVLIGVHGIALSGWANNYPLAGWITVGVSLAYFLITMFLWYRFGPLTLPKPHRELWPPEKLSEAVVVG